MRVVNMHEAKTHLSKLVQAAAEGEPFVIARAGTPLVKVVPLAEPVQKPKRRLGFYSGELSVPDDFDTMMADEIKEMFHDGQLFPGETTS